MRVGTQIKQPNEVLSVSVWYDEALDPRDYIERILMHSVDPPGAMTVYPMIAEPARVRLHLIGGADRQRYKVTVRVQTHLGETLEDELTVKVKEI